MLAHLQKSKEAFEAMDYVLALVEIEKDWEYISEKNFSYFIRLHILLRELAGDYIGALEDVDNYQISDVVIRIRLLSKLGYYKEAQELVLNEMKKLPPTNRMKRDLIGLAGRRIDLLLNGIRLEDEDKNIEFNAILDPYCVVEHLLSLSKIELLKEVHNYFKKIVPETTINGLAKENKISAATLKDISSISFMNNVRGWLSEDEAFILFNFAKKIPEEHNIVEIGAWHGRSTLSLSYGSSRGLHAKVHSVDTHEGLPGIGGETYSKLLKNLRRYGFDNVVKIHKGKSKCVGRNWNFGEIGLLFIDGSHDYDSVKLDFSTWAPHMADGGYVLFHDVNQCGPNKFIRGLLLNNTNIVPIGYIDSIFAIRYYHIPVENKATNFWTNFLKDRYIAYDNWIKGEEDSLRNELRELYKQMEV